MWPEARATKAGLRGSLTLFRRGSGETTLKLLKHVSVRPRGAIQLPLILGDSQSWSLSNKG